MRIDRRIAELAEIPLRWASRSSNSLRIFRHTLLAIGKPGTRRTLWFGFGVLILLLLALGTVFTLRLGTISTHLRVQTEIIRPRVAAAREMEILLLSFVGNARGFLNGNAESRQLAEADAGQMAAYLAEYVRLAETGEQRQMAAEFSAQWSELRDHAATLLSRAQSSTEDLRKMSAMRVKLRHLIDKRIQPDSLAFQEARTTATLSSLAHSLRLSFLLLCGATLLALFTSVATARTVLNSQEALRKSETFLGEVLNSSFAGVYVYDLQRAAHVFINRQYTVLTGHTLDGFGSMDGQAFLSLFHPEDAPRVTEHIEQVGRAADGKVLEIEYRFRTADGRWIWVLSRDAIFTRNADGSMRQLIGSALDITARKQAEEALRESEQRLRLAQQVARIGTFDWDVLHGVNIWSPETEALYGLEPGTFSGTQAAWEELIYPEDHPSLLALVERTCQTGKAAEAEFRVQWPDGSIHWLISRWQAIQNASGDLVRVTGVNLDITARKQAEGELLARKRELKRVLDTATSGLALCSRDLSYVYVNPPFAQMVGLSMEQIVGRTIREVIGEPAFELIRPYLDRTLRGERVEYEIEVPLSYGIRYMQVVYTPDEDSDGGIAGFFVSLADLTAQKSLEREVLRITETERQRVGSELHESICQELISAGCTAKALQRKLEKERNPLAPDLAALSNAISQTAAHTRQLAHGMNPVVNSPDGLENALRELSTLTGEGHDLNCQFECNSLVTLPDADPVVNTQLFRIAQEAVHNAVRHSGAKRIEVKLDQSESEVCLAVKDDGRGLPTHVDKASGFGLRSMRYRAGLIHGTLSIQNREGGGTVVICHVLNRPATGETREGTG